MEKQIKRVSIFKYACLINPIHRFTGCMNAKDYAANLLVHTLGPDMERSTLRLLALRFTAIMNMEVVQKTLELCGEEPDNVLFFSVPSLDDEVFTPCAISQVYEQGKTYLFTSNCDFAAIYAAHDWEVKIW